MSAREVMVESATTGFKYGFMIAIFALIQSKGDIEKSATCGDAFSVGMAAYELSMFFFVPKRERPLFNKSADDVESDTQDE